MSICAVTPVFSGRSMDSYRSVPVQVSVWVMGCVTVVYCKRGFWVCYTRFSIPGRGCSIGTVASMLPACWASCKTGMLHNGHTFLTSNHLMRHLEERKSSKLRILQENGFITLHIGLHIRQYWYIADRPISANNIGQQIYKSSSNTKYNICYSQVNLAYHKCIILAHIAIT